MSPWIIDPVSKLPSVPLTAFVAGGAVATFKLLTSGLIVGHVQFGVFGGTDFAAVMGALGALYWAHDNATVGQTPPKETT